MRSSTKHLRPPGVLPLALDGYDLRKLPLEERKALLKKLIAKTAIQFSESLEVDGREMFALIADCLDPGPRDAGQMLNELIAILDRDELCDAIIETLVHERVAAMKLR